MRKKRGVQTQKETVYMCNPEIIILIKEIGNVTKNLFARIERIEKYLSK